MRAPLAMARILGSYIAMHLIFNIFQFYCIIKVWRGFFPFLNLKKVADCEFLNCLNLFLKFPSLSIKTCFLIFQGDKLSPQPGQQHTQPIRGSPLSFFPMSTEKIVMSKPISAILSFFILLENFLSLILFCKSKFTCVGTSVVL